MGPLSSLFATFDVFNLNPEFLAKLRFGGEDDGMEEEASSGCILPITPVQKVAVNLLFPIVMLLLWLLTFNLHHLLRSCTNLKVCARARVRFFFGGGV